MNEIETIQELFYHQLRDIYSAEDQLIKNLPLMADGVNSAPFKKAIDGHLKDTKKHKKRLDEIEKIVGINLSGEICRAIQALIKKVSPLITVDSKNSANNKGIMTLAQKMEHYEISAYRTAIHFAIALDYKRTVRMLQQTLNEEKEADRRLTSLNP